MAGRVAYYGGIVKDGLVLDLDAAKKESYPGSGTRWNDIAGGVITGSLINGPTFNSNNGGSIVFDGADDYVNLGTTSFGITRDFTISFWMDMTQSGSMQIFTKGYNVPYGIYIAKQPSNVLTCQLNLTSGYGETNTITTNYSGIKNWVVIRNNTSLTWYVNGSQDSTSTLSSFDISQSLSKQWRIGSNFDIAFTPFNGNIYTTQLYNRALSAAEITQNYNALKGRYGL